MKSQYVKQCNTNWFCACKAEIILRLHLKVATFYSHLDLIFNCYSAQMITSSYIMNHNSGS